MTHSSLQLLGYFASLLIATSLLMRSIVRLRLINLAGALTFSVYGFLIHAYPVGVLNLLTASINVVQLIRLRRRREIFRILEIARDSPYLRYFLDFQADDIRRFFPRFQYEETPDTVVLLVLRDLIPAGMVIGKAVGDIFQVELDYVVPQFRDLKVGRFMFVDQADLFRQRGFREILSPGDTVEHAKYLQQIGYVAVGNGRTYRLDLSVERT